MGSNSALNKEGGGNEGAEKMLSQSLLCLLSDPFPTLAALLCPTGNCSAQASLLIGFWAGRFGKYKTMAEDRG